MGLGSAVPAVQQALAQVEGHLVRVGVRVRVRDMVWVRVWVRVRVRVWARVRVRVRVRVWVRFRVGSGLGLA